MEKRNLIINNSHYIIVLDGGKLALLDSGAPFSLGVTAHCELNGHTYSLSEDKNMIEKVNNSNLLDNCVIDIIIGLDILMHHRFDFDKENKIVSIDEVSDIEFSHKIPIQVKSISGFGMEQKYVVFDVLVNNQNVTALLDTGAWISYLSETNLEGVDSIGSVEDYNPQIGKINTTKHQVDVTIGNFSQSMVVAKMPTMLELLLSMISISFIMGLDSIDCKRVVLDISKGELLF